MPTSKGARFIRKSINFLFSNPIIKSLMKIIPMVWFSIVLGNTFCEFFGSKTPNGVIKDEWMKATIIIYIFITAYLFLEQFYIRYMEKREKAYSALAFEVIDSVDSLYNDTLNVLIDSFIKHKKSGNPLQALYNDYDHEKRITALLKQLIKCIHKVTDIDTTNISASLLYKFKDDKWNLFGEKYCGVFKDAEDLATNPESFAYYLLNNKSYDFILLNNKYKEGIKHKENGKKCPIYKKNERDDKASGRKKNRHGSIAGLRFNINSINDTYLQATLFISTFGSRIDNSFCEIYRETVESNLRDYILPYFEMNLKTELIYLGSEK